MGAEPPEIVILAGDGAVEPLPPERPVRGTGTAARRWGGLLIGVLLVFGMGFAAGRGSGYRSGYGTGYDTGYDAALAGSSSASDTPSGAPSSAGQLAAASSHAATSSHAAASSHAEAAADDACAAPRPIAAVVGARPLPASAPRLHLIAGGDGTVIDTAAAPSSAGGAARDRLFPPGSPSSSLTVAMSASAGDVLGVTRSCGDPRDVQLRRATPIPAHGGPAGVSAGFTVSSVDVPLRADEHVAGFLTGSGAGPYLVTYAQSAESGQPAPRFSLVALDAARDPVTLPAGFSPVGIAGGYVLGSRTVRPLGGDPDLRGFVIQIVSPASGAVTAQLGPAAAQMLVVGDSVIWQPRCDTGCEIHGYVVGTGEDSVIGQGPRVPVGSRVWWRAASPDGTRIAMVVASPAASRPPAQASGSAFGVVVADRATGRVDAARGVAVTSPSVSMAFTSDSRWLLVGVGTGNGGEVVAYDDDMRGPYEVARVPGAGGGAVPLALLPPS